MEKAKHRKCERCRHIRSKKETDVMYGEYTTHYCHKFKLMALKFSSEALSSVLNRRITELNVQPESLAWDCKYFKESEE